MKTIDLNNKTILVTGAAGFIGFTLVQKLLEELSDARIIGFDNLNDYYDPAIKQWRLEELSRIQERHPENRWFFVKGDLCDVGTLQLVFETYKPAIVVNLAAQAGVRYSITNPDSYIQSNLIGFYHLLEACRHSGDNGGRGVEHLVYASSSSVYGGRTTVPFRTDDPVDRPESLYAATKKSNELMAHVYAKLYNIPATGLRFFTVIGGKTSRPDMCLQKFTDILLRGGTVQIYNYGNCKRDFTNVYDICDGIMQVMQGAPERTVSMDGLPVAPSAVYNIGHGNPESLLDFVSILQEELVKIGLLPQDYDFDAHKQLVPMQPGDVPITFADTSALLRDYGYRPMTDLRTSIQQFLHWYREFYTDHENKPFSN